MTPRCWWCKRFVKHYVPMQDRPMGCTNCKDRDPWDTPFWCFVREVAAEADKLPHWKRNPIAGCNCQHCKPHFASTVEAKSSNKVAEKRKAKSGYAMGER